MSLENEILFNSKKEIEKKPVHDFSLGDTSDARSKRIIATAESLKKNIMK